MAHECVVLADCPGALVELCGISTLERLLRTLQRCGIERATILSSASERIAEELARPSWPRAQLALALRTRPNGAVTNRTDSSTFGRTPLSFFSSSEAMPSSTVAYCSCSRHKDHPQSWSIRLCRRNFNRWWLRPRTHCTRRSAVRHCYNATGFRPRVVLSRRRSTTAWNKTPLRQSMSPTNPPTHRPCGEGSGRFGFRRRLRHMSN